MTTDCCCATIKTRSHCRRMNITVINSRQHTPSRLRSPPPSAQTAAKACDTVLKKYKGNQLARALKAFAVIKCGKRAEGLQVKLRKTLRGLPRNHRSTANGMKVARCLHARSCPVLLQFLNSHHLPA